jgi:hypothetical protein
MQILKNKREYSVTIFPFFFLKKKSKFENLKKIEFFGGPHLSRFDLNNMISTYTKRIFHGKNGPNLPGFQEKK